MCVEGVKLGKSREVFYSSMRCRFSASKRHVYGKVATKVRSRVEPEFLYPLGRPMRYPAISSDEFLSMCFSFSLLNYNFLFRPDRTYKVSG
jgi:hypothetical protein